MIHNYDIMSLKSLRRLCGHLFTEPMLFPADFSPQRRFHVLYVVLTLIFRCFDIIILAMLCVNDGKFEPCPGVR